MLIVGLGNPGKEYTATRHNVGYMCVDNLVDKHSEFSDWITKKDLHCYLTTGILGSVRVIAIKPTTFMNESGQAMKAVQQFYKIANSNTIVVYDELDQIFGQIRTRSGGGAAGHNGIKSLITHCGDSFGRVRIGIHNEYKPRTETSDFVLKPFSATEKNHLVSMQKEVENILIEAIYAEKLEPQTRSFIIS